MKPPGLAKPLAALLGVVLAVAASAAPAAGRDYSGIARNIIPSGQYGSVPPPPEADDQARLYDGLTPLFDDVSSRDVFRFFKSEKFGTRGQGPLTREPEPEPGLKIVRDRWNVPHITGKSRYDVAFGAGWVLAEDRYLLLEQGRYNARVAAIDAPGIDAFALVTGLRQFTPSAQTEAYVRRQTKLLRRRGRKGRQLLRDIDAYIDGLNANYRENGRAGRPWTRNDVYAINALAGQIFGRGGGDEARRSMLLDGLRNRLGFTRGFQVWNDLRERMDPEHPVTIKKSFPYQFRRPRHRTGNLVLDDGSFEPTAGPRTATSSARRIELVPSNFLMVGRRRSVFGHPLFVAGPQVGYFYPGLTLEMDIRGPRGMQARGASAPGWPGYMLIGRGQDFAWSLTSAGSDVVDEYVERLCGGSDTRYLYKGRCRRMGFFDAGRLDDGQRVRFRTTVHGPVTGYARVRGRRVAISEKRSSRGRDVLWQLMFQDFTLNRVKSPRSFFRAAAQSPFTFNVAYADDRDIAMFSAGRLPLRARGVDIGLPTDGRGRREWRGFLSTRRHPQQVNPRDGDLVNWNEKPAKDFTASDSRWNYGSVFRVNMLQVGIDKRRRHSLRTVVAAMNRAATTDFRVFRLLPVVADVLETGPAPSPRARRMLQLLKDYRRAGASRLDRDLDGDVDHPGAAIIDASWVRIADAVMRPVLGPQNEVLNEIVGADSSPGNDFTGGRTWYVHKDLRTLLGRRVRGKFRTRFCGRGDLDACRDSLWAAIEAAGNQLASEQGPNPDAWRADANAERKRFVPGVLSTTIRYTNRPSGIQQVLFFKGHRPRAARRRAAGPRFTG